MIYLSCFKQFTKERKIIVNSNFDFNTSVYKENDLKEIKASTNEQWILIISISVTSSSRSIVRSVVDLDIGIIDIEVLDHFKGLSINLKFGNVKSRFSWKNTVSKFTLFFLESKGNSSNWSSLNSFHQMSNVTSDLISET